MLKYKHQLTHREDLMTVYHTFYIVTTDKQTIIVMEFSDQEEEIDRYLWSL